MIRLGYIFLIAFMLPIMALAHGDRIELNMSGVIHDSRTNQPVGGALISIEKNGQMIYSTRSSEDGSFSLKFEGPIGRHDQLQVKVAKKGFEIKSFPPVNLHKEDMIINLKRKSPIPILKPVNQGSQLIAI